MHTVTALFDTRAAAEAAATRLRTIDVPDSSITISGTETIAATHDKGFWETLGELFGDDRDVYAEGVRRGGWLLTVNYLDEALHARAVDILDDEGTVNLDERVESWRAEGWSGTDRPVAAAIPATAETDAAYAAERAGETVIPIVEERLKVGKRDTSTGRVRVRSYVTETPTAENVTLREQHVTVERRAADRPATEADIRAADTVVEAEERSEEAVAGTEKRVVGEVVVRTDETARTETVTGTERKTEVDTQQVDDPTKPKPTDTV